MHTRVSVRVFVSMNPTRVRLCIRVYESSSCASQNFSPIILDQSFVTRMIFDINFSFTQEIDLRWSTHKIVILSLFNLLVIEIKFSTKSTSLLNDSIN